MKLNNSFLFILMFTVISCGVRNDDIAYTNPFVGNWKFSGMDCYDTDIDGGKKEIYLSNVLHTNEIFFAGRTFVYSVSEGGGACNTSANGNYLIDYTSDIEGKLSYSSITNSLNCEIVHDETTGAVNGTIPFGIITTTANTTNLYWKVLGDELTLQVSTGYQGTAKPAYCVSNCTCYSRYKKDDSN